MSNQTVFRKISVTWQARKLLTEYDSGKIQAFVAANKLIGALSAEDAASVDDFYGLLQTLIAWIEAK